MVTFCYLAAICVKDIGAVISIAGATVNPFIGFLFPIIFYLKLTSDKESQTEQGWIGFAEKCLAYFVAMIISLITVAGFVNLFK